MPIQKRRLVNPIRIIIGAAIASQVPPFMVIFLMIAATGIGIHLLMAPLIYMVAMTITAPYFALFGVPTYFILRYLRWDTWWLMTILGMFFGIASWEINGLLWNSHRPPELALDQYLQASRQFGIAFFAATGGLVGLVFWCVGYLDLEPEGGRSGANQG